MLSELNLAPKVLKDSEGNSPLGQEDLHPAFPDKGYGFLATSEGRKFYFHPISVLNWAFGRLKDGTRVTFAEERGDKGPQASSLRIMAKQGTRRVGKQPAA